MTAGMRGSSNRRRRRLVFPLAIVCGLIALTGRAEAAGGAFVVDDSEVGKPGECKVESWTSFASNHDFIGVVSPACVLQIFRPVELGAQFQRARSDGVWDTGLTLKGKTSFIPVEGHPFGLGLSGGVTFDLINGGTSAAFFSVPVTFQLAEPLRLNLNIGGLWDLANDRSFVTWGAGFEYSLKKPFTLIGEVFGQGSQNTGAQIGIRYTPVEKIDFDLIYGRNLTGEHANWITLGFNLRN
jgi:hypothetical protein